MIVCVQCALKAMVRNEPIPEFTGTMEEHMRHHHADAYATYVERRFLQYAIARKLYWDRPVDHDEVNDLVKYPFGSVSDKLDAPIRMNPEQTSEDTSELSELPASDPSSDPK